LGYRDFLTLIAKKGLDVAKLRSESPTTTLWFDATQVLARAGPDWDLFRTRPPAMSVSRSRLALSAGQLIGKVATFRGS
jgi:hypothetical protein